MHPELIPESDLREPNYRVAMKGAPRCFNTAVLALMISVCMAVGPMSQQDAARFEKDWKRETRSDTKVYEREPIGHSLAQKKGLKAVSIQVSPKASANKGGA
jgi:hypothetical protein